MSGFLLFMLGGFLGIVAMSLLSANSYNKGYKDGCEDTIREFEKKSKEGK